MLKADPALAELLLIQKANPSEGLDAAWNRGDHRFLGIAGFSTEVPGVESHYEEIVRPTGVRVITGTGDQVTDAIAELFPKAKEYASRYNKLLLVRLSVTMGLPHER